MARGSSGTTSTVRRKMTGLSRLAALVASIAASVSAGLTVGDSLNRYSLFALERLSIGYRANTAQGGWVGSDYFLLQGENSIRSQVTAGQFEVVGTSDTIWGHVRVNRNMMGAGFYNARFDSGASVRGDVSVQHNVRIDQGLKLAGGTLSMEAWANPSNVFAGNVFGNGAATTFTSSNTVPGVSWNAAEPAIDLNLQIPDTTITTGTLAITDPGQDRTWKCAANPLQPVPACVAGDSVLPPGRYGDVTVRFGSTLYLGEGVYEFNSLTMQNSTMANPTRLLALQPKGARTVVLVKNGVTLGNNMASRPGVIAPSLYYKGYGTDSSKFAGGTMLFYSEQPLTLANYVDVWATVVSPANTVTIRQTVRLFGQVFAKRIQVENDFKGTDGAFIPYYPKPPRIKVANFGWTGLEGAAGQKTSAVFTLQMDHVNGLPVTVWYHTATPARDTVVGGRTFKPARPGDYDSLPGGGSITVDPTLTGAQFSFSVNGNGIHQENRYFVVVLDSIRNGTLDSSVLWNGKVAGGGYILDDDPTPALGVRGTKAVEGTGAGTRAFKFLVSLLDSATGAPLDPAMSDGARFAWSTVAGTAGASDFTPVVSQTVAWPAGKSSDTLFVQVRQDSSWEPDETFSVSLVPVDASVQIASPWAVPKASDTISNDDTPPTLRIADASASEGGVARFVATLSVASAFPACFDWRTSDSTAVAGSDYKADSGKAVCIPAGSLSRNLDVQTIADALYEATERFKVAASPVSGITLAGSRMAAVGSITDDDPRPRLWIRDTDVQRPAAGWTVARFVVSLLDSLTGSVATPSGVPTVFSWRTAAGTALADTDFVSASGIDTLLPGSTSDTVKILVRGDSRYHPPLQFSVLLDTPSTVAPAVSRLAAVGTIRSSKGRPAISVAPASLAEGDAGTRPFAFVVSLRDSASGDEVASRVDMPFSWTSAAGTARDGVDFLALAGSGKIPAGSASATVVMDSAIGNLLHQADRSFSATVSPSGTDLRPGNAVATGTILDDDPTPLVSVADVSVARDTVDGSRKPVWFKVGLTDPRTGQPTASGLPVGVRWKTVDSTAVAGLDFAADSGVLTIPVGTVADSFSVDVLGDSRFVPDNAFKVALGGISGAAFADSLGVATLRGGARKPMVELEGGSVVRRPSYGDTVSLPFRYHLVDPATGRRVSSRAAIQFGWSTFDSTAKSDSDYVAVSDRGASLAAADPEDTLLVTVIGLGYYSKPRLVGASIAPRDTSWVSGDLSRARAVGTIYDPRNVLASFVSGDTSVAEDMVPDTVRLVVRIQKPSTEIVTVPVVVDASRTTAEAGRNYRLLDSLAVFPTGDTLDTLRLLVLHDTVYSGGVKVVLRLLPNLDDTIGVVDPSRVEVSLLEADPVPRLAFLDTLVEVTESDTIVSIRLGLDRASTLPVSGEIAVVGGSAVSGDDFVLASGAFVFPPRSVAASVPLRLLDDERFGPTRDLVLSWKRLADSLRAGFDPSRDSERVVVREDDPPPAILFAEDTIAVDDVSGSVAIRVVLDAASDSVALASLVLDAARGGAGAVSMVPDSGYGLGIAAGKLDTSWTLRFGNDGRAGPDRVVHLVLRDPRGSVLGTDSVLVVVIRNTNRPPEVVVTLPGDSARVRDSVQRIEWTWNGVPQASSDTTLREGWNRVSRCAVDAAGNVGCDTNMVWGDFTAPAVRVFKITGPSPLEPSRDTTWWGDRARTRFGSDTVWYWVRDSILGVDGIWRVRADTFRVVTGFTGDGVFPTQVRACDSVGNCSVDTGWIDLKQSTPEVEIVTPPDGSRVPAGWVPVEWKVRDGGKSVSGSDVESVPSPGERRIVRCWTDDVGNTGCDTATVEVQPVHVLQSQYLDTDGDGRVDAAVVELDSRWTGTVFPGFDFRWGDSIRTGCVPDASHPFHAGPSRGAKLVVGSDTLTVVAGPYLTDSVGTPLRDAEGNPITGVMGDTAKGLDGKPLRDSLGRVLYEVAGDGQVDSTRFLVPIRPPFAFGMTGFDSAQSARMISKWTETDSAGNVRSMTFVDTFAVADKVPPVIVAAEIRRVENYDDPDTLFVTPSEPIDLGAGRDWLQVGRCPANASSCDPRDMVWVDVPDSAVKKLADGRYWFLVPPESLGIRPDYRVRFRSDVSDRLGNRVDTANLDWSTAISGPARPEFVEILPPSRIPTIPSEEANRSAPGGILIRATKGIGGESTLGWWEPGRGYISSEDPEVRSICPMPDYCNGPKVHINRPVRLIIYIYDKAGTFAARRTVDISQRDIDAMEPDELDRLSIELDWNHRTENGKLVSSGVYIWRIVTYLKQKGPGLPAMTNRLVQVGVKVRSD